MPNPNRAIKVEMHSDLATGGKAFIARVEDYILAESSHAILREIVKQIADRYVAENYQQIVAGISQEAIATMSVAESAAAIRESLEREIPARVVEIERKTTEVWQRGILDRLRRIR